MQVRNYIFVQSSWPSIGSAPVQGEGMDAWPLPSEFHLDNGPQMDLATRDLWDLDDDQLWEVLEVIQLETARREGAASPHGSPRGSLQVPGAVGKLTWMMGKWSFWGGGVGT